MVNEEQLDRVWGIIERVGICMLTTRFAGGLRARPLEARPDRDHGRIWFVTDLHSGKEQEIELRTMSASCSSMHAKRRTSRSRHAHRGFATPPRPRRSGNRLTMCGGAVPTIQMSACWVSRSLPPNCGTGRRQSRRRVRIRQGAAYWRQAEFGGKPQSDGQSTRMPQRHKPRELPPPRAANGF